MRIIADSQGDRALGSELREKGEKALRLLEAETDRDRFEKLRALADVLREHTPLSFLAGPNARQIADWLVQFLDLIEGRKGPAAVRLLPYGEKGHALLATNSPDAPFLVNSIQAFLSEQDLHFHMVSHPILAVQRRDGTIAGLGGADKGWPLESLVIIELKGRPVGSASRFEPEVERLIREVLRVQDDRDSIMERLRELEEGAEQQNLRDFLAWTQEDNFLPFSYRRFLVQEGEEGRTCAIEEAEAALGLPPDPSEPDYSRVTPLDQLPQAFREQLLREGPVVVETTERMSPILRAEPLIYLGFRERVGNRAWKEHAFLGLFSEKSVDELAFNVPFLRSRIEGALDALSIPKGCHDYRKTVDIFNSFPKVELFFMDPAELTEAVRSFSLLFRQGAVKVVAIRSLGVRGLTLLVIMPREFYSAEIMPRIEAYLCRYFRASAAASRVIHIASDYLSLHIRVNPEEEEVRLDLDRLEGGLTDIARPWELRLRLLFDRTFGETEGAKMWKKYEGSFSREYRALIHPRFAIRDVKCLEQVLSGGEEVLDLWGPFSTHEDHYYRLQFYSAKESYLNEIMPLLENLNLCVIEEADFNLRVDEREVFIKSFAVRGAEAAPSLSELKGVLLEALGALRRGEVENDYLNRLLVLTGLSWKEIDVFRGYRNYYFQLGSSYTKRRVAFALIHNPRAALLLYRYFEARFRLDPKWEDPLKREEEGLSPIRQELIIALEGVSDINEDDILRILFNLIDSTVRTNFFLRRDRKDYFFSFKISALGIIDMPAPRPMYEIYVHSATMEGIHLRGGKVARGGIRWSDRPDDFRTEVLGLMKTQMTKNALIVPVGSKGGFVVKTPFGSREEGASLSAEAYKTLIRGLLDVTDNVVGGRTVRAEGIVAYDEEDPYLVVAADKGTAHLPDTANAVAAEYGFWLGDGFASGGSKGYDHKALGITARGAWECVKRHFREMGIDTQTEPFSVVGIGDMSGDVFGNGMLLSDRIRLLAAFNHRHIFLDPDPDPAVSFQERKRLFALPRSSWDDYDRSLISDGGGVFPRDAKNIPLSPQVRASLGVRHESMDGQGLIRLILGAEADLLWNGGIGTYVKAGSEKDEDAGDRTNDPVRIDASQLRVKVVGEGGNLGLTQKGRIEYALGGGRINTDAVDNSGGVDCSDHEVNLKIFMQYLTDSGEISPGEERDRILEEVTDEVCGQVLKNNYGQSLSLSLDLERCSEDAEPFLELADRLSTAGLMDRSGEFLPSAREVRARKERCLTRPELAILMAYSKMQLYQSLLDSGLPDRPGARDYLASYFPAAIRERFGDKLDSHPLAREVTATVITNHLVDQAGSAFLQNMSRRSGASLDQVAAAYLVFDRVVNGPELRRAVFGLDNRMGAERQHRLLLRLEDAQAALCGWALENEMEILPDEAEVNRLRGKALAYLKNLGGILSEKEWQGCKAIAESLEGEGLDPARSLEFATLPYLKDFLPVMSLAERCGVDLYSVARTFKEVRDHVGIREVLRMVGDVQVRDRWDRRAQQALEGAFGNAAFGLAGAVMDEAGGNPDTYFSSRRQRLKFYRRLREDLGTAVPMNFHPFTALLRALESMLP